MAATVSEFGARPPCVVVMGVSGSGKSTIGARVAAELGVPFLDGDDLHPPANVTKMASGTPLTDHDRRPWLREVGRSLRGHESTGVVVACSALRRRYRSAILIEAPGVVFVHLHGGRNIIHARMVARSAHFMPASLLTSQLDALEPLGEDEPGVTIDINAPHGVVVAQVLHALSGREVR